MRTAARLAADLRSGLRVLRTYPMLSLVAVATLGLGLGLATMVFSIVNGALFKGLPFDEPDRVVALVGRNIVTHDGQMSIPVQDLPRWRERQTVFDEFGAYGQTSINLSSDGRRPERVSAGQLTVAAFQVIGVKPILGRGFLSGDDTIGAAPVVLISYDVWRDRYGKAADILNQSVRANGVPTTIVGVMPERFGFPETEHLWVPLRFNPLATPRGSGPEYRIIARLARGVTVAEAGAQATVIAADIERDFPQTNRGVTAAVMPFAELALGHDVYALLYTMLGAGIGVLVIACVNVSNLLVARASLRRREIAVRVALGATRADVVRQHLTEVLLLAGAGAAIGLVISSAGVRWFSDALSVDPPPFWMTFGVDAHVVLFVGAVILLAALAAGALPALHASRVPAGAAMKDDSRSATSGRLGRLSGGLVVAELAVSCGLLIAAGLMIKSVVQLKYVKMPFAVEHVLTMRIDLPHETYPDDRARTRFFDALLPHLTAVAGVEAASLSDRLPATGGGSTPVQLDGRAYAQESDYPVVRENAVTPSYFQTYQASILRGRAFTEADSATSEQVAIINESFARQLSPGADPIGRRLRRGRGDAKAPWLTIVGVVPDLLMQGIGDKAQNPAGFYRPVAQGRDWDSVTIAIRSQGDMTAGSAQVRSALVTIDPDLPVYDVLTMDQALRRETFYYNVFGTLFTGFGVSALFLAAAGLYGVMSFAVTQRTREMGVRSALGARGAQLVRLMMRRSIVQLVIGLALGLGLGLSASGPLEVVLFDVDPHDPVIVSTVVVVLAVTSLVATALPAWRVTRIDPAIALAAE